MREPFVGATDRLRRLTRRAREWFAEPPEAPLVCEIAESYVAALRHRRGHVEAWATRPLPQGVIRPGPLAENFVNPRAVQEALEQVVGAVDGHSRNCALVIPDAVARVVLLDLERLPARPAEAEELLRWRLGKDMSFDLRQARISYEAHPGTDGNQEVLVTVSLQNLLRQYEEAVEALHIRPGYVTLSLLAAMGWCRPEEGEPQLLIKKNPSSLALGIFQDGAVRLFRTLPLPGFGEAPQPDAILFEKMLPALVYFEDHWGQAVRRARFCGLGPEARDLAERLRQEANCEADELNVEPTDMPPSALSGEEGDQNLLPSLGWIKGRGGA